MIEFSSLNYRLFLLIQYFRECTGGSSPASSSSVLADVPGSEVPTYKACIPGCTVTVVTSLWRGFCQASSGSCLQGVECKGAVHTGECLFSREPVDVTVF